MSKENFYKKNDPKFLPLGFKKDDDPQFAYKKCLVPYELLEETMEENGLTEDELPHLLFGQSANNSGFCIYTGEHFVWLNILEPEDAIKICNNISAVEPV